MDEALLSSWIFRPWPTGRKFKLLRTNLLLRALAMGFARDLLLAYRALILAIGVSSVYLTSVY